MGHQRKALLVVALLLVQECEPWAPEADHHDVDQEVYQTVWKVLSAEFGAVELQEGTQWLDPFSSSCLSEESTCVLPDLLAKRFPTMKNSTATSFIEEARLRWKPRQVTVDWRDQDGHRGGLEEPPEIPLVAFSHVGYDPGMMEALVHADVWSKRGRTGKYFFLRRDGEAWEVVGSVDAWVT